MTTNPATTDPFDSISLAQAQLAAASDTLRTRLAGYVEQLATAQAKVDELAAELALKNPDPPPTPTAIPATLLVGAQGHLVWDVVTPTVLDDRLDKLAAAGVKLIRIDTSGQAWNPTKAGFSAGAKLHGGKLDRALDGIRARGMQAIVTIFESPMWAVPGSPTARRLPDDPTTMYPLGKYAAEYLAKWGTTIAGLEVWNEPSLKDFDDKGPRPAFYLACLTSFYLGAKSTVAGARVPIVLGAPDQVAVSPTPGKDPAAHASTQRTQWITVLYQLLAGKLRPWDVMATHIYPGTNPPATVSNGTTGYLVDQLRYLDATMRFYGDTSPVYVTELGYSAHLNTPLAGVAQKNYEGGVTEKQQGGYTVAALDRIATEFPAVRGVVIYTDEETPAPASVKTTAARHQAGFGILRAGTRATDKPIYAALAARAARILTP